MIKPLMSASACGIYANGIDKFGLPTKAQFSSKFGPYFSKNECVDRYQFTNLDLRNETTSTLGIFLLHKEKQEHILIETKVLLKIEF